MNAHTTILVEREPPIATITLNRPKALNALNATMIGELRLAFEALEIDEEIRAVVLTGAGERAFAAGADIAELNALPAAREAALLAHNGQALTLQMERSRLPIVVAVNGFALGGGCELAMAGDIRIASENAYFGQPEVKLGLMPGYGGTQRTLRLLGRGMAMMLCVAGDPIDAQEAHRVGLAQRVVPLAGLLAEAKGVAELIASHAPLAVAATKRAIVDGGGIPLAEALALEALAFGTIATTADAREGTRAFLDKREAAFTGH